MKIIWMKGSSRFSTGESIIAENVSLIMGDIIVNLLNKNKVSENHYILKEDDYKLKNV